MTDRRGGVSLWDKDAHCDDDEAYVFVFVGRIFDTEPATIITHNLVPVHAGGWRAFVDLGSRTLPRDMQRGFY